jgi:hypothetical protein
MSDTDIATMSGIAPGSAVSVDPRRSLMVTDQSILASFTFDEFMTRVASQSPTPISKQALFNQWWDTNNRKPGLGMGAHCDDNLDSNGQPTMNGFQIQCPRAEGAQATVTDTFDPNSNNSYIPIALVNRFDLASNPALGGTDCGEYRIIFAKKSGTTDTHNRNMLVFEGVLPNPNPNGHDLSGCVPVARFWASLSAISDPTQRAAQLHSFYYDGLPGFQPIVRAASYGNSTPHATGQVRTNQFMQSNWMLRQYRLQVVNNVLQFVPMPAGSNPEGLLFNETISNPKSSDFRSAFVNLVSSLAINDINRINMNALSATFDAFDSDEQDPMKTNYADQFVSSPNFAASIQAQLDASGNPQGLTAADIVARAQTTSCAGCHQLSNNKNLGGGLVWPASLGFAHTAENQTETAPDGPSGALRYLISPALKQLFLPRRQDVIQTFLDGQPSSQAQALRRGRRTK